MNRKVTIRFVTLAVVLMVVFVAYNFFKTSLINFGDWSAVDTTGAIAALQETDQGTKVVVFSPSGQKRDLPGANPTVIDRDLSWSPNGYQVYFSSNRSPVESKDDRFAFNIFRWKYGEDKVETFTNQRRSESAPRFGPVGDGKTGLVLSGGNVVDFDPAEKKGSQVLPPTAKYQSSSEEGGGAQSSIDALYSKFGDSFRQALWAPQSSGMLAVMRRDDGEVLIFHSFGVGDHGEPRPPMGIMAGSKIQMDQAADGRFIVTQADASPPDLESPPKEWIKDGKMFPNMNGQPLTHMVWFGHFEGDLPKLEPMIPPTTGNPSQPQPMFADPAISPDGTQFAVVVSQKSPDGKTQSAALLVGKLAADGLSNTNAHIIASGQISQPSWSPDGKNLVFVVFNGQHQAIYAVNSDGSGRRVIADDANYSMPKFSPQLPKKTGA